LWDLHWEQGPGKWLWNGHGTPGAGVSIVQEPGTLIYYGQIPSLFVLGSNGHVFERFFDSGASVWARSDHGTPAPGVLAATTPGAGLSSTNVENAPQNPFVFVGGSDGQLWGLFLDHDGNGDWGPSHGAPPGSSVASAPVGLLSTEVSISFFVRAANGHIAEHFWDSETATWSWNDIEPPPNTTAETAPTVCFSSVIENNIVQGASLFVIGADQNLWEHAFSRAAL
jgi:hypothetical protein